ncbi:hypothetical protein EVAR_101151_1 [Eumeta japonica]|uniref:Uncharacterized protein n=1 Tax=Eumeta variegata TaxID=151549 RepID=A0A4C2AD06_EUMVA|nr:hypothetical protein EVAR_101151_1 [Eumeta japonica]
MPTPLGRPARRRPPRRLQYTRAVGRTAPRHRSTTNRPDLTRRRRRLAGMRRGDARKGGGGAEEGAAIPQQRSRQQMRPTPARPARLRQRRPRPCPPYIGNGAVGPQPHLTTKA